MIVHEVYDISGMSCAACSSAVERVTRRLEGVLHSDVNLMMNQMTIEYDDTKVESSAICQKVVNAGFGCSLHIENTDTETLSARDAPQVQSSSAQQKVSSRRELVLLWVSVIFAAALLYVSMGSMAPHPFPLPAVFNMHTHAQNFALLQLLLALPVMYIGRRFYIRGFKALFLGNPDMDTLVAVGSSVSFIYSLVLTFMLQDNHMLVHGLFYESASVVVAFVSIGKYLEGQSKEKTKDAIRKLVELAPDTALLIKDDGSVVEVKTSQLRVGDIIRVLPGQKIPSDGTVVAGEGGVDESMLTGESMPVEKTAGMSITGGSLNGSAQLDVCVTRIGKDTTLSRIVSFVEEAQGKKAPIARVADKVAGVFVPVVMTIALAAGIVWTAAGVLAAHGIIALPSAWTINAGFVLRVIVSILVIACPCALGLATPTAIMVGTGLGARHGILIRSGEALETAHSIDTVVFDKTGTITKGKPEVSDVITAPGVSEKEMLAHAAAIEKGSTHPLADAVVRNAEEKGIAPLKAVQIVSLAGRGLRGAIADENGKPLDDDVVLAGSRAFMMENFINTSVLDAKADELASQGKSLVYVARIGHSSQIPSAEEEVRSSRLLGVFAVADPVRQESAQAVERLKKMGIAVVLLTGDNKKTASYIGTQIGADTVIAGVLPEQKAQKISELQSAGHKVMMVGDGINDAPALVQADVGAAIGAGSDVAVESGDIVLMKNDPEDAARAIRLSRLTIRNIRENLFWAFCYNTIGIPLAAGVLYPAFGILLTPMFGALAMSLSSVCVVGNALRLRTKKL
jgi:Cu+-exporting ATPase